MKRILSRTIERAVWLGLIVALAGVLLTVMAAHSEGALGVILANIGTAILTVGLVGILYDLLLREKLVHEVLSVVGVRESVSTFGLQKIEESTSIRLSDLLVDAKEVTVLPLDPLRWLDQDFSAVSRHARERKLNVTLLLPANESPYVQILAERLGKTEAQVQQVLDQAARGDVGEAWDAFGVHEDSTLTIKRFGGVPTTGMVRTDRWLALELGPMIRYRQLDREGFVIVVDRDHSPAARWIKDQLLRELSDENLSAIDQRPHPPTEHREDEMNER